MPFQYDNESYPSLHPWNTSPWNGDCLSLLGYNTMLAPFKALPGTAISPSYAFQGNERTGFFLPSVDEFQFVITAFPVFGIRENLISLINYYGYKTSLRGNQTADRVLDLPDKDGVLATLDDTNRFLTTLTNGEAFTVQAGQPVRISGSSFYLAQGDSLAHEAQAVCFEQTATGNSGRLMLTGLITKTDWTLVTGSTTLTPGEEYFLAEPTAGILTTTPPNTTGICQYVGMATTSDELYVNLAQAIKL